MLVHPRVVVGLSGDGIPTRVAKLPIQSPTGIAALGDVDEAFPLLPQVAIVVHGEEVAVVIEGDFLRIAQAGGIDLQIRSVGVHPQDAAGVRVPKDSAFAIGDREPVVAAGEVEFPVGPHDESVQVVAIEGGVDSEPAEFRLLGVRDAIVIGVAKPLQFRIARDPHRVVPGQHSGDDSGDLLIETLGEELRAVGMPVVLRVIQSADAFLHRFQIVPIVHPVAVEIAEPRSIFLTPFRSHPSAEGVAEVSNGLVGQVFHQPFPVATDVDVHRAASRRFGDIQHALVVETQSDRIHHHRFASPQGKPQSLRGHGLGSGIGGPGRTGCQDRSQREVEPM